MYQYVKLQGLKYNFRKVQGYFWKNPRLRQLSGIYELIFYGEVVE
jgi:hypothetical protein